VADPSGAGSDLVEPDDLLVLSDEAGQRQRLGQSQGQRLGQGLGVRELVGRLLGFGERFLGLGVRFLELGDLGHLRIGDLAGLMPWRSGVVRGRGLISSIRKGTAEGSGCRTWSGTGGVLFMPRTPGISVTVGKAAPPGLRRPKTAPLQDRRSKTRLPHPLRHSQTPRSLLAILRFLDSLAPGHSPPPGPLLPIGLKWMLFRGGGGLCVHAGGRGFWARKRWPLAAEARTAAKP
jgi:hypothetical protein